MKRILLVRTDRVGDVVVITPMIREIRKTFPDAFIATLTQPQNKDLLINNPHLNISITDDLKKKSFWKVVKEIRKYKFTHGLLLMPTERAAYQMFWAGIRNRIGVGHKLYEVITGMKSVSRNNYTPLRHEADYCMDLARKIGVKTNNLVPEIFLTNEEKKEAAEILKSRGIENNDKKIIIHTGSFGSSPNWSEEKYFELIKKILLDIKDEKIKILLTAREMSKDFLDKVKGLDSNRIINVSDFYQSLRDLIKIIEKSNVLFGPSTGPLHIADALNHNAVALYCHRAMNCAKSWGLRNKNSINIEVSEENCKKYCSADQSKCGIENGVSIDEAFKAIKSLLNKKQAGK